MGENPGAKAPLWLRPWVTHYCLSHSCTAKFHQLQFDVDYWIPSAGNVYG